MLVTECAAHGTLQINEFMPLLASALLESMELLAAGATAFAAHVDGIEANAARCAAFVDDSPALITAFLPQLGYEKASALVQAYITMKKGGSGQSFRAFMADNLGEAAVAETLTPQNLVRPVPEIIQL